MQSFNFHSPTLILYGEGTAYGIADLITTYKAERPLVVTDNNLRTTGVIQPILDSIKELGLKKGPVIFDKVPPDSDINCIREGVRLGRSEECDLVIAVGGGSVIDSAKVINIGLSLEDDVLSYEGINNLTSKLLPFIAIPTTSGTGSEMSAVAMIKDHELGKKLLFGSRYLYADAAILDPLLTIGLPPKLTAATGLDAITHCLESLVSIGENPISNSLAMNALLILCNYLPLATKNGQDLEARGQTLLASTMAGISFTNAGVGIIHALAHTIGARFGAHHGLANTVFLPFGLKFNMSSVEEKYKKICQYIVRELINTGDNENTKVVNNSFAKLVKSQNVSGESLVEMVELIIEECNLPTRLNQIGVPNLSDREIDELAEMALTDPAIMFNPKEASLEDLAEIIRRAY